MWGIKGGEFERRFFDTCLASRQRIDYLNHYFLHRLTRNAAHDPNLRPDPRIEKEIKKQCVKQEVSCAQAFEIAERLNVTPMEVGRTADLMNMKVVKCQLGLFGYKPEKKIVRAEEASDRALQEAVRGSSEDNRLTCEKAWQIAGQLNISKLLVCNVSQANRIQIKGCQLGAFLMVHRA